MCKKVISIIALIVLAVCCLNSNQPTGDVSARQTVDAGSDNYADLYQPVVNAYITLEQSGYTSYDESILGDDVCLTPNGGGSYFIGYDTEPTLVYTFYDLNSDGIPELLIGAELGAADNPAGSNVFITGIYGLRDCKTVSLLQAGTWSQLNVFTDNSGDCIIKETSGTHIDYIAEFFYKIDKNETLVALDKLYTYGKINDYNNTDDITCSHSKDVNGKELSITEQEYLVLMQKYGSVGYLDDIDGYFADEIAINSWKLLTEYK